MNVLIFGGTGCMGVPLTNMLVNNGMQVFVTSRQEHTSVGNLHYLCGDAKDFEFVKQTLSNTNFDVIVDFMSYTTKEFAERVQFLLEHTTQYIFLSSCRVYAESKSPIKEDSPRLLETCTDTDYLKSDDYALAKARQEDILRNSGKRNWTIVRPTITYGTYRLPLGAHDKEEWLYRASKGRSIVLSKELANKRTCMTDGHDVAKIICSIIGRNDCLGESYNAVDSKSYTWAEVLRMYETALRNINGGGTRTVLGGKSIKLKDPRQKYQVLYARGIDRNFDNSKIREFYKDDFISLEIGIEQALKEFLAAPRFLYINWAQEALSDKAARERTPLSEINGVKNKLLYIAYLYNMGWLYDGLKKCYQLVK